MACIQALFSSNAPSHMQVAAACEADPDCFVYDVRRRGRSLVRLGATRNITTAALRLGFPSLLSFLDAAERHMEAVCLVATFCLVPPGDTATRKGLFDAILSGCIPVLLYRESAHFPWHLPADAQTFAVLLSAALVLEDPEHIMRALRGVPPAEIQAKQRALAALAHRVQYSAGEQSSAERAELGPDALDLVLAGLAHGLRGGEAELRRHE